MASKNEYVSDEGKAVSSEEQLSVDLKEFKIDTFVKGFHVYKSKWKPHAGEKLQAAIEPDNVVDKYAVCVLKNNELIGHLPKGTNGKFAKTIFYFLRADKYGSCHVFIKDKVVNLGHGDGMQVPCTLFFEGSSNFIEILQRQLLVVDI